MAGNERYLDDERGIINIIAYMNTTSTASTTKSDSEDLRSDFGQRVGMKYGCVYNFTRLELEPNVLGGPRTQQATESASWVRNRGRNEATPPYGVRFLVSSGGLWWTQSRGGTSENG
jgi:hypothetical protein